jgi:hypothetical protein
MDQGLICFPTQIDNIENASAFVFSLPVHHELLYGSFKTLLVAGLYNVEWYDDR